MREPRGPGPARSGADCQRGQALAEFALTFPLFLLSLMVTIQVGMIVIQQYGLMAVTQGTTRWLSINANAHSDADTLSHARAFPSWLNVPAWLDPASILSITTSPSCASTPCSRTLGDALTVTVVYDLARWLFLPAQLNFPWFSGALSVPILPVRAASSACAGQPTCLPPFSVTVPVECC